MMQWPQICEVSLLGTKNVCGGKGFVEQVKNRPPALTRSILWHTLLIIRLSCALLSVLKSASLVAFLLETKADSE